MLWKVKPDTWRPFSAAAMHLPEHLVWPWMDASFEKKNGPVSTREFCTSESSAHVVQIPICIAVLILAPLNWLDPSFNVERNVYDRALAASWNQNATSVPRKYSMLMAHACEFSCPAVPQGSQISHSAVPKAAYRKKPQHFTSKIEILKSDFTYCLIL